MADRLVPFDDSGDRLRLSARWPVGPLMKLAGGRVALCERSGNDLRTIDRWTSDDKHFDDIQADQLAVAIGLHPRDIWRDWFDIDIVLDGEDPDGRWEQETLLD